MASKKSTPSPEISNILEVRTATVTCYILGSSPLMMNRLCEKAKHELLMPGKRKNAVDKATILKHDPVKEFRASAHQLSDPTAPTLLAIPATAIKQSIRTAALDMTGASKAQIGRLTYIAGEYVPVYGLPLLDMRPVRMADIGRTPDIRTRAYLPAWACKVAITFVDPLIREQAVINLLAAAGITVGIGDGRQEKGGLSFGQFGLVAPTDPAWLAIVASGGRAAQQAAMDAPTAANDETTELLSWYDTELSRRKIHGVA